MMFRKDNDIPKEVREARVNAWYSSLDERDKNRLSRYLGVSDTSSSFSFYISAADAALKDENYAFAASLCEQCLKEKLSDMQIFSVNELLIDAYIGTKRYDDAKALCEKNLRIYPQLKDGILKANDGKIPEKMNCRNRYVDIVVGIESGYDFAFALLDRFLEMGLISEEDHAYRKQSLKIHRLQRSFDGVFTYSYKE